MMRSIFAPAALLTALPAVAADKAAAAATSAPGATGGLFQVFFGLFVVLAVMGAIAWLLKRSGVARTGAGQVVRIVGGVSVGTRERVMVLEVADQWIVVGVAPGQVSPLHTMPRQELPAQEALAGKPDFAAWLKNTIDKRKMG